MADAAEQKTGEACIIDGKAFAAGLRATVGARWLRSKANMV